MFYTVKEMRSKPTAQIPRDLGRDYEAVLDFVQKVQDVSEEIDEFELYDVCEAGKIYATAGEKLIEDWDESPHERGLKKGRVRFLVCKDLQNADEYIAEYGDGSIILCTDDYTIYGEIEEKEGWTAIWLSPIRYLRHRRCPHKHL